MIILKDVKSTAEGSAEIYDRKEDSHFPYDFAAPVASFFKESRRQVERYFRGNTNDVDVNDDEKENYRPMEGKN